MSRISKMTRVAVSCMAVALASGAWAAKETVGDYTWTYRIIGDTVEIYNNGYAAISPEPTGIVSIPDMLGGKTVASIGERAFYGCSGLTSVSIPNCVTSIGAYAFNGCHEFSNVNIPDSVTNIEDCAFYYCGDLTSVSIGKGVVSIGANAFYGCEKLASVTIGDGVTKIGSGAFSGCSESLYDTATLSGVKLLDGWVVGYTDSLPDDLNLVGIRGIGDYTFWDCRGLTSVTIPNVEMRIADYAFIGCDGLTNVIIGIGITHVGHSAFSGCSGLTNLRIPNSVTRIESEAFFECNALNSVTIPDSVTDIGDCAFYGCSGLTSVTIPDSVTNIASGAFAWCDGLMSVTIPACVTRLEETFPSTYESITNVVMSDSVTDIGDRAFFGCSGLTSVAIPDSVTNIASEAFAWCDSLTVMTIPNSIMSIGDDAFYGCSGLTNMTIPDSVKNIGDYAFCACGSLTNVVIGNGVTNIGNRAFSDCNGLTHLTIGNSVTSIGWNAFDNCSGLESITIPNSVTNIGNSAFYFCSGLTRVYLPLSFGGSTDVFPRSATIIRYKPVQTVTLDVADGVVSSGFVAVDYGGKYGALPIPSWTGRSFIGWMSNGNWVSDETIVQELDDHVLVAQWQVNQYAVTFDANGGEGGESEQMDYGSVIVPPTVTRQYYDFVGWSPEVDSTVPASNVTYRALWRPVNMKILCAYPFRRNVDHTRESGFFGCAIPANVITNVDAQPLLSEWFGIQVQVDTSGMADIDLESIEVHMAWFVGESPWGWENWKGNANVKDVVLERAADWSADNLVYRSNPTVQESFVPPQVSGENGYRVVQYQIWIEHNDKNGNPQGIRYLDASDWMRPVWYDPLDLNKNHGSFSAYTILDHIPPRRVWINEVNMYQCGNINDAVHQYIEIAAPIGYDLTGWSVSAVQQGDGYDLRPLFTMGHGSVAPMKFAPSNGNYTFYAVQSPLTRDAGTYGPLDGTWKWNAFSRYDGREDITRPCALRLQRPSGIIEHEIVFMCTNRWAGSCFAYVGEGTNFLKEVKENIASGDANQWLYAGADDQGSANVDYALGVYSGHGEENTWTNMMIQTPGEANRLADGSQQFIDSNYFKPPTDNILWIYANVEWSSRDFLSMVVEGTTNTSAVIVAPQNFDGTYTASIVFLVNDGFEIANVTTNSGIVTEASGKTGAWTFDLRSIGLSDMDSRRLVVEASVRLVGSGADLIPAVATDASPEIVTLALDGTVDMNLTANVTNATQYIAYRDWALSVTNGTMTAQMIKESTRTWLSYALGADALIGKEITSNDVRIVAFEATNADSGAMGSSHPTSFAFEVAIDGVNIGGGMVAVEMLKENLKKVLDVEGATTLSPDAFSSDNIEITFDTPVDGKARFIATPPANAGNTFFMRVKVK